MTKLVCIETSKGGRCPSCGISVPGWDGATHWRHPCSTCRAVEIYEFKIKKRDEDLKDDKSAPWDECRAKEAGARDCKGPLDCDGTCHRMAPLLWEQRAIKRKRKGKPAVQPRVEEVHLEENTEDEWL